MIFSLADVEYAITSYSQWLYPEDCTRKKAKLSYVLV